MSAPLKSFEGPDVQLLLDQIRADVGPGAKINGAEKIRVGGVLGFFAKEHYRVVVEGPGTAAGGDTPSAGDNSRSGTDGDGSSRPAPSRAAGPTDVFSAMADATDDVNDVGAISAMAPSPARKAPARKAPARSTPVAGTPAPSGAVAGPAAEGPAVAESFDAVLTRVATTLDAVPPDRQRAHKPCRRLSTGNGHGRSRSPRCAR